MLELIIALLLSLGIHLDDKSNISNLSKDASDAIKSDSRFDELGGEAALNSFLKGNEIGSKSEDDIVVTVDPNPPASEEHQN